MHTQTRVTYTFLYLMLFFPILSYLSGVLLGSLDTLYNFRILTIIYGVFFIYSHKNTLKIPKAAYFLLAFSIYQYIWSFFNLNFLGRFVNLSTLIGNTHFATFFILIIVYNTTFKDSFIKNTIFILKITILFAAIVIIIQFFYVGFWNAAGYWDTVKDIILERDIYTNRRTSIFGFIDANSMGLDFLPLLSLLYGYSLISRSKQRSILLILGGIIAMLTNTRYVMIGFVIIAIQFLTYNKLKFGIIVKYAILTILIVYIFAQSLILLGFSINDWITQRLIAEGTLENSERFKAITTFISFFPKSIFLGLGGLTTGLERASILDRSSYVHVGYLRFLLFYGIIGCFFLFSSWFLILKKFYKTAKASNFWGSFFAFIAFLWSFATMYEASIFFYGLIFAFVFDKYYSDKVIRKKIMYSSIQLKANV